MWNEKLFLDKPQFFTNLKCFALLDIRFVRNSRNIVRSGLLYVRSGLIYVRKAFLRLGGVVENVSLSLDLGGFPNFFIDSYTFSKIKPLLTYAAEGFRVPSQSFCAE
ncbi:hypothetical protein ABEV54_08985 [Peribacillus psychrosaccharolyticus]|uniref:hypothetical protein n=1 Tax=Peribacillus psychrosaccharolyticus TaxID=1407 RepID=UPI003D2D3F8E